MKPLLCLLFLCSALVVVVAAEVPSAEDSESCRREVGRGRAWVAGRQALVEAVGGASWAPLELLSRATSEERAAEVCASDASADEPSAAQLASAAALGVIANAGLLLPVCRGVVEKSRATLASLGLARPELTEALLAQLPGTEEACEALLGEAAVPKPLTTTPNPETSCVSCKVCMVTTRVAQIEVFNNPKRKREALEKVKTVVCPSIANLTKSDTIYQDCLYFAPDLTRAVLSEMHASLEPEVFCRDGGQCQGGREETLPECERELCNHELDFVKELPKALELPALILLKALCDILPASPASFLL